MPCFRYFDCKALHGLFAPVHKVARLAGAMSMSTPSPNTRSLGSGLRSARERSGSQESVSSISSSASSVSRSRVRLGVTSLANQVHAASLLLPPTSVPRSVCQALCGLGLTNYTRNELKTEACAWTYLLPLISIIQIFFLKKLFKRFIGSKTLTCKCVLAGEFISLWIMMLHLHRQIFQYACDGPLFTQKSW